MTWRRRRNSSDKRNTERNIDLSGRSAEDDFATMQYKGTARPGQSMVRPFGPSMKPDGGKARWPGPGEACEQRTKGLIIAAMACGARRSTARHSRSRFAAGSGARHGEWIRNAS